MQMETEGLKNRHWRSRRVFSAEYLARCARAWLVWAPEGYGWDCFRPYEAALAGSVPLISRQTIERYEPFIDNQHCIYYDVEVGHLALAVRRALQDRVACYEWLKRHVLTCCNTIRRPHWRSCCAEHIERRTAAAAAKHANSMRYSVAIGVWSHLRIRARIGSTGLPHDSIATDLLFKEIAEIVVFKEKLLGSSRSYWACTVRCKGDIVKITSAHRANPVTIEDQVASYIPFIKEFERAALTANPDIRFIDDEFRETMGTRLLGFFRYGWPFC